MGRGGGGGVGAYGVPHSLAPKCAHTLHYCKTVHFSYAEEHQAEDILCTGFQNQKENPFREKSSCSIL